jgi:hypothetical protein
MDGRAAEQGRRPLIRGEAMRPCAGPAHRFRPRWSFFNTLSGPLPAPAGPSRTATGGRDSREPGLRLVRQGAIAFRGVRDRPPRHSRPADVPA